MQRNVMPSPSGSKSPTRVGIELLLGPDVEGTIILETLVTFLQPK
jgi:hypothetical protein